jgi:hypothetical protein
MGKMSFRPGSTGDNNEAATGGLDFTVPEMDVLADFLGHPTDPKLVLYVGGNYFLVMAPLVQAFEAAHPDYKGRIYWETIPPSSREAVVAGTRGPPECFRARSRTDCTVPPSRPAIETSDARVESPV